MSALGTLSAGAGGVAGLLSLRRRAAPAPAAAATPPHLPAIKLPDGGPLVWGRQLRPSLLLPAASQPARRHTLRQPAAAAASESAGSVSPPTLLCLTSLSTLVASSCSVFN